MDTRKGNLIYSMFLFITIPLFLVFIFVPMFRATAEKSYNIDYNKTLEIGDYILKITDAAYLTDLNEFDFMLSVKANGKPQGSYPEITNINFVYSEGEKKQVETDGYEIIQLSEMSQLVKVKDVKMDIVYAEIIAYSTDPDYYEKDRVDEFGDVTKGELIKGERHGQRVRIDKKDIQFIAENAYAPVGKGFDEQEKVTSNNENKVPVQTTTRASQATRRSNNTISSTAENNNSSRTESFNSQPESSQGLSSDVSSKAESSSQAEQNNGSSNHNNGGNTEQNEPQTEHTTQTEAYTQRETERDTERQTEATTRQTTTTTAATTVTTTTTPAPTTTTTTTTTARTETQPAIINVYEISLNTGVDNGIIQLSVDQNYKVEAVVLPSNASDRSVRFYSNKPAIAEVDNDGNIKAVSAGKAIITAETTDGGLTASVMVWVS